MLSCNFYFRLLYDFFYLLSSMNCLYKFPFFFLFMLNIWRVYSISLLLSVINFIFVNFKKSSTEWIYLPLRTLCCNMNCALWICLGVPVIVMIRSSEPGKASSILIMAFDWDRMRLIRSPPLPMMDPANCKWDIRIRIQKFLSF